LIITANYQHLKLTENGFKVRLRVIIGFRFRMRTTDT